jgi:hypothetical protein
MFTNGNIDAFSSIEIADFMGANVFKNSNLKKCLQKTTHVYAVATLRI